MLPAAGAEAADFRAGVLSAIEEAAYFPKKALNKGIHGQAVVQFTFHRYGSITGLELVKTSGSDALDQAAVRILERASKRFPQFPDHFPKESVTYVVPIVFKAKPSGGN
jgi:protein TonB